MGLITSKLLLLGLIGGISIVGSRSFIRGRMKRKWASFAGIIAFIFVIMGVVCVVVSPPGMEDTVEEKDRANPSKPTDDHLGRLRLGWDSTTEAAWPAAETLVLLCQISYKPPVDAEDAYQKLGFQQITTFADASMIGYVVSAADTSVVVFRGTDDVADWFTNLNNFTTATRHGPIHAGFNQAY